MQDASNNPRLGRLTSLDTAVSRLRELLPVVRPEVRKLDHSIGKVLAADVVVGADLPRAPIAYMDGWAVHSSSTVGASSYGTAPLDRSPAWVDAGDPMPEGDAILSASEVSIAEDGSAEALAPAAPGQGVRMPGQDASAATALVKQGTRLDARHIGVLGSCGIDSATVNVPCVRVVLASSAARPHVHMLSAWLAEAGAELADVVGDGERAVDLAALYRRSDVDLVVSIGGTGQGRNDGAVAALAAAGVVDVHGIALRPGASAGFGRVGSTCVLLLPGRIDSLLASLLVLGLPALASLTGSRADDRFVTAPIVEKATSAVGVSEVLLAIATASGIRPLPLAEARLDVICAAAGWFLLPAPLEGMAAGSTIRWQRF
jgi:molybdopterin biosynthesis enzyme